MTDRRLHESIINHYPSCFPPHSPPLLFLLYFLRLHAFFPHIPLSPLPPPPFLPAQFFTDAFWPDHTEAVGLQQETYPDLLRRDGVQRLDEQARLPVHPTRSFISSPSTTCTAPPPAFHPASHRHPLIPLRLSSLGVELRQ